MKTSIFFTLAIMAFVSVAIIAPLAASAQTTMATMPTLYNQNGAAVNVGNTTPLAEGYYYLQPGQTSTQVYYYGNGTYYNQNTGIFGGSVKNPNGRAGVSLGYSTAVTDPSVVASSPLVPNTGAGGMAPTMWSVMIASAAILIAGGAYFMNRRMYAIQS